jgi:CRP-like cAMP-binding protein
MTNSTSAKYESLLLFVNRFMQLSEEEFSQLMGMLLFREFPKKHILINEGEIAQNLYFITRGLIHQYFYAGKEVVTTDVVCEGTITGSVSSFLSGKPSHYYLETMESTSAFIISKQQLNELYKKDIKWQRFGRILITHFLLQQEWHILDNIRFSIRERLLHFAEAYPGLLKRVPQRRLASYLDMKPETFSRIKPYIVAKK